MSKIQLNNPVLNGNEKKYLLQCIKSNWLSGSGSFVKKFEEKITKFTKAKYSTAIINGTSALQLAIRLVGCKPNDEIIVPTITFIAPINAVIYNFCHPIFMDSDNYFNIDENKCIDFILKETFYKNGNTYNKKTRKKISAIIVVHVWGNAANMVNLIKLCKQRNIKVIEDASESLGTFYKDRHKNQHTGLVGDIGCISFNTNKVITCGSGGMIITNNKNYYLQSRYLSTQAKNNEVYYIHNSTGYNFRLNNLNAAVGLAQIEKINFFLKKKKKLFNYYRKVINHNNFYLMDTPQYSLNNNWMNILKFSNKKILLNDLINLFQKNNVQVRPIWFLNHKQKMFRNYQNYNISNAQKLLKNSLCLPSGADLNDLHINKINRLLNKI